MFERLSNGEVRSAIDLLIGSVGVKEPIPSQELLARLAEGDAHGCAQGIARQLDLPIRIILSYVSTTDTRNAVKFQTKALARTDSQGRGRESITAQVLFVPEQVPIYGTARLSGYPIEVRVSENCHSNPDAFITIMAHELSHILLETLRHPKRDSELYVDLTPIVLGFGEIVSWRRKTVELWDGGRTTTTYGYLTDSQFDFAYDYVVDVLHRRQQHKSALSEAVLRMQLMVRRAADSLSAYRDCMSYLDTHLPKKMRKKDAERLVKLHGHDPSQEWERRLEGYTAQTEKAASYARGVNHFTSGQVESLRNHAKGLETACQQLEQLQEEISKEVQLMRRYVSFLHKLRRNLGW